MDHAPDRNGRIRLVAPTLRARTMRVASSMATIALAGWLASGSCTVAACYEECDPCFQACKCSSICHNLLASEQGLRIVAHESRVVVADDEQFVRSLGVVLGPSLELARRDSKRADPRRADPEQADERADPRRLADFARRILDVNAELFTSQREPVWTIVDAQAFPERSVLHFALEPEHFAPRRANTVSLLFDGRGRLLEATHVVDRGSD